MAKWDIKRACGHEETIQIYGPSKDRDRQAEYESGKLCYACYQAQQVAGRAQASAKAAEQSRAAGLPALNGSPKQIAWAESIRAEYMAKIARIEPLIVANPQARGAEQAALALPQIKATASARTSAHEWIERRDRTAADDLKDVVRAMMG